jgi:hypothetical protein
MTETNKNNIEFKGIAAVRLASCIAKNLQIFYSLKFMSGELYNRYSQNGFDEFLKENLKREEFLNDCVNLTDFAGGEIELIMSFARDSNGIEYTPSMVNALDIKKIKEVIKSVLSGLFKLDFYFFNGDAPDGSIDLKEKWRECAKNGNADADLTVMANM